MWILTNQRECVEKCVLECVLLAFLFIIIISSIPIDKGNTFLFGVAYFISSYTLFSFKTLATPT